MNYQTIKRLQMWFDVCGFVEEKTLVEQFGKPFFDLVEAKGIIVFEQYRGSLYGLNRPKLKYWLRRLKKDYIVSTKVQQYNKLLDKLVEAQHKYEQLIHQHCCAENGWKLSFPMTNYLGGLYESTVRFCNELSVRLWQLFHQIGMKSIPIRHPSIYRIIPLYLVIQKLKNQ